MMSDDNGTTELKKDELSLISPASDIEEDITAKKHAQLEIPSKSVHEVTSCSSVLESSDPLSAKPESHSMVFRTSVLARRYKITLAQARRMAMNVAKRAERRRARALEKEADIEGPAGNIE